MDLTTLAFLLLVKRACSGLCSSGRKAENARCDNQCNELFHAGSPLLLTLMNAKGERDKHHDSLARVGIRRGMKWGARVDAMKGWVSL